MSSVNSIDANLNNSINQIEIIDSTSKGKFTSECSPKLLDKFNEVMTKDSNNTNSMNSMNNSSLSHNILNNLDVNNLANSEKFPSLSEKSLKTKDFEVKNQNNQVNSNEAMGNKEDLSSIFSQLMPNSQMQTVNQNDLNIVTSNTEATNNTSSLAQDTQKIVDELVERILISDPDINGNQQVVIQLGKNSILNGTIIILTRALDGTLGVLINPKDRDQFKTIAEAKQDLEFALQKHEKGMINITINDSSTKNDEQYNQGNQFNDPYSFV